MEQERRDIYFLHKDGTWSLWDGIRNIDVDHDNVLYKETKIYKQPKIKLGKPGNKSWELFQGEAKEIQFPANTADGTQFTFEDSERNQANEEQDFEKAWAEFMAWKAEQKKAAEDKEKRERVWKGYHFTLFGFDFSLFFKPKEKK